MISNARMGTLIILALGGLMGCSDSGGNSSNGGPSDPLTFSDYDQALSDLQNEAGAAGFFEPADLPATGAAQYEGTIALATNEFASEQVAMAGELTIGVDFANPMDAISGAATDFVDDENNRLDGSLVLSDGLVDRTADPVTFPYQFDVAGTLTSPADGELVFDGGAQGDFLGEDGPDYMVGVHGGTVLINGEEQVYSGEFAAER
jgi:hypothetical protein